MAYVGLVQGFLCGFVVKKPPAICRRHRRCRFIPWVRKMPWRRKWQPAAVFLPGDSHGQRSLVGYNPSGCKSWTGLSN